MYSAYKHADSSYKAQVQQTIQLHIKKQNKDAARENKTKDKEMTKIGDDTLCVECFNLQEVLSTPNSFESILYYKITLNSINRSIYYLGSSDAV